MVATVFQNGYKSAKAALPHQKVAQSHRQQIKAMLPNRVVGYSPDLARIVGGATTGLFLSQILYLSDKGANPEGWVYKSEAEMGKETGLTKREQQTARRKLLSRGVIAIMRGGWKNTYHFKVLWEKLYQVIAGFQQIQNVPTAQDERPQTVATEQVQNVPTQPPKWQQNVATQWKQNAAAHYREKESVWQQTLEKVQEGLPTGETATKLFGTALLEVTETAARIGVNNLSALLWLERRLYGQIQKAMKGVLGKDLDLQFVPAV